MNTTADLPDLNVWLALASREHSHHRQAIRYWEQQAAERVLFCTVTALGLVRLVRQPKLMGAAVMSAVEASALLQAFWRQPGVSLAAPEHDGFEVFHQVLRHGDLPARLCTDAYRAELAIANDWRLVSFDRDFERFEGLQWLQPSLTHLITPTDRIFVAGHRGMAGSAICRALQRAGYHQLLCATRQELDLLDAAAVQRGFGEHQPSVVVLAAAKVGGIEANNSYPADFLLENLKIQNNVIESARRSGSRRLLFLGSSCIYPRECPQPIKEEYLLTGPLEPTNEWYAIAKIAGIKLCQALRKQHGFDAISLMPTNLYGPGDNYHPENSHVMAAMIRRCHEAKESGLASVTCWGTGSPLREFLHVDDLGDAVVFGLEHWAPDIDANIIHLNAGTGKDLTIKDLAELVAGVVGYDGTILWDPGKPDGTRKKQLDTGKLTNYGWSAKINLVDGLTATYAAFLEESRK